MSKKLNLRNLLALIAIPPILLLALIAAFGLSSFFLGDPTADELKTDALTLGLVAIAGMLLSAGMVLVIGRRIVEPIDEVSDAARELADVRLPKLIESLSSPGVSMPEFEPLAVSGHTELAELGEALNSLQNRAVTVANEQQRVVKQGISELVVNLARRNQSLLDRQIENIDALESTEEDPDRLESLFRLDHLATRMRRNAESLLVLSGAEPSRRRGGPVVLADVIRVAMSEIEDYQHVSMGDVRTAHIGPQGAVDVAHLMSELLENATQFSPPDAPVSVGADFDVNGSYEIVIEDHGIGMSAEQLLVANQTILDPPELGLALTRSLGFQVIGRLAQRLGVTVHLSHTEGGGTTASVKIPGGALSSGAAANVPAAFQSMPTAPLSERQTDVPVQSPLGQATPSAPPTPRPAPSPRPEPASHHLPPPASGPEPASESPWADEAPSPHQRSTPTTFEQPAPHQQQAPAPRQAPAPQPAPHQQQAPSQAPAPQPAPHQQQAPSQAPAPRQAPAPQQAPRQAPAPQQAPHQQQAPRQAPAPQQAPHQQQAPRQAPAPQPAPHQQQAPRQAPAPQPAPHQQQAPRQAPAPQPAPHQQQAPSQAPAPQPAPHQHQAPAPRQAPAPQPAPESWSAPQALDPTAAPANMAQAMPTGQAFEQGMDALLDDPANRTTSGLVRRDRSQNHAPQSEGRSIPAADAAPAATASNRSPEEIRNMLPRYRDGLKGRPDAGQGHH